MRLSLMLTVVGLEIEMLKLLVVLFLLPTAHCVHYYYCCWSDAAHYLYCSLLANDDDVDLTICLEFQSPSFICLQLKNNASLPVDSFRLDLSRSTQERMMRCNADNTYVGNGGAAVMIRLSVSVSVYEVCKL